MQPPIVPLQLVPFAFDPLELAAQSFRSLAPPILRLGPTSCLTLHTTFMAYSLSKYNPIIWIAGPDPVTSYQQGNVTPFEHVLNLDEGVSFNWSDPFPFAPDMMDDHTFLVEAFGDGQTRFIQTDVFTGTGSEGLTTLGLATIVRDAYVSFNRELKNEVEK